MATIEEFILRFKTQGQDQIKSATNSVKNLGKEVADLAQQGGGVQGVLSGILGKLGPVGAAAGVVGAAFGATALKAINMADAMADISDATGVSAGALNNLKNSLITAGGKADDFANLAVRLNKNVGEAASGNENLQKTFKTLGVFVTDANGNLRDTGVILQDAIGKLAGISDPATRAKLAVELFGKEAAKLDFTKLNAVNDPFKDEQIKQLAKYRDAIDAIAVSASNNLLTVFGKLAVAIDEAQKKAAKVEEEANKRGMIGPRTTTAGTSIVTMPERPMTAKEKAEYELQQKIKEQTNQMPGELARLQGRTQTGGGGFGATPEATLKAAAESEKRLRQSNIDANKNIALKGANDIQTIEINAAAEIAKARESIYQQERLSNDQKAAEFAAKRREIESKAANDIAKTRSQLNARIFSEEEAQRQANAEAIAAQQKQFEGAAKTARERADSYQEARQDLEDQIMLEESLRGLGATQANTQREIAAEIKKRTDAIKDLANIENLTYEDRLKQEERIRADSAATIELIKKRGADELARQQNFMSGWEDAWAAYKDNAMKYSEQAKSSFDNALTGLEDAFVRAVQTGKLSFKDLANSIIADLARIAFKRAVMSIGTFFGLPGLAEGGPVMANSPYIVGEKGPELFVPKTAGSIVPNGALSSGGGSSIMGSTTVNYNIQAVDAASFRSLVARDPSFIYAVTEQGRRSQPTRSR